MTREQIKKSLQDIGYTHDSIKSLMCGRALPSMSKAIELNQKYNVPFEVWINIKSYLQHHTNKVPSKYTTSSSKKVSA